VTGRAIDLDGGRIAPIYADGLVVARGIPYGRAARFHAPEPYPSWTGVRDTTRRGPACPQLPSRLAWLAGSVTDGLRTDEQCLVVTVTAPAEATNLPVMVWFHGGAYMSGSGEAAVYDAQSLAREGDVIVVSVSYRLGVFGYLTPDGSSDHNLGLRDQLTALRWVQTNITAFGGNPSEVTLFGQSAGADSVWALMACEDSDGLFRRAILQSAPLGAHEGRPPMVAAMRAAFADNLRGTHPAAATVEQLLRAQTAAVAAAQSFPAAGLPYAPIVGEAPLPASDQFSARITHCATMIDLLVGYTKDDAAPFIALAYGAPSTDVAEVLGTDEAREAVAALTQRIFSGPAEQLACTWTDNGGQVGTYRVDWAPPGAPLGACHCIELPLLFGTPTAWAGAAMLGPSHHPIDDALATSMRGEWSAFAHHGAAGLTDRQLTFG
jgi:para-nitrobenzyl esterase